MFPVKTFLRTENESQLALVAEKYFFCYDYFMKLYRFSPITTDTQLRETVSYLIEQELQLAVKAAGSLLPITYLTIFAHYDTEYDKLVTLINTWGETSQANNGIKVKLKTPIEENDQYITELRIRKPDPYRMQVGCCDFGVTDYPGFKNTHLGKSSNLRLIERPDYEMIEFFDFDFDVLGYVVSP